jgi:hypothetical protein
VTVEYADPLVRPKQPNEEDVVLHLACERGRSDDNWAHRFQPASGLGNGGMIEVPVIYCAACGQVRRLEVPR